MGQVKDFRPARAARRAENSRAERRRDFSPPPWQYVSNKNIQREKPYDEQALR
jgi:hypothetical protein